MDWILSVERMQSMDERATIELGIPSLSLMENAGAHAAQLILQKLRTTSTKKLSIICGSGNNGGDGYVIARHLLMNNIRPHVIAIGDPERIRPDARVNRKTLLALGHPVADVLDQEHLPDLRQAGLIIDCILGTGLKGAARGLAAQVIRLVADSGSPVISIDIPSGVEGDTGMAPGPFVIAAETLTMGTFKRGHKLQPGHELGGPVTCVPIGYSPDWFACEEDWTMPQGRDLAPSLPKRSSALHKNSAGKVLVIAGSRGMTGAAMLACRAALRSGCGLVKLLCPESLNVIFETALPEIMTVPLPDDGCGFLRHTNLEAMREHLAWADAVLLGPGMGRHGDTMTLCRKLVGCLQSTLVLDADALAAFADHGTLLEECDQEVILTPHPGELTALLNAEPMDHHERIQAAMELSDELLSVILVKGSPTALVTPEGECHINSTGNHGLATAGTGDVLAGVICSLSAQGLSPEGAAIMGSWLHGRAADLGAQAPGPRSLIASDLLGFLPAALNELEKSL